MLHILIYRSFINKNSELRKYQNDKFILFNEYLMVAKVGKSKHDKETDRRKLIQDIEIHNLYMIIMVVKHNTVKKTWILSLRVNSSSINLFIIQLS